MPPEKKRKSILDIIRTRDYPEAKSRTAQFIEEEAIEPVRKAGYADVADALSTGSREAVDFALPDDDMDLALSLLPAGKALSAGKKMGKFAGSKFKNFMKDKAKEEAIHKAQQMKNREAMRPVAESEASRASAKQLPAVRKKFGLEDIE